MFIQYITLYFSREYLLVAFVSPQITVSLYFIYTLLCIDINPKLSYPSSKSAPFSVKASMYRDLWLALSDQVQHSTNTHIKISAALEIALGAVKL